MISERDVKHIAKLARIGLTSTELEKFQKELSSILSYIEKLKEVDISRAEIVSHSVKVGNVTREDVARDKKEKIENKIIELMPETKGRYLKVKPIFQV